MRFIFKIFPIIFVAVFVLGIVWNIIVFQDCRAHGKALYQCQAAMSNPHYYAVEDIGNQ